MHRRILRARYLVIIILLVVVFYGISESEIFKNVLSNPETLKDFILGFGILAPLAIILLQTFQTVISIIPSQITTVVSGFVFGPILGLFYSLIGAFIGSSIVFFIAKKYGERIALNFFDKKDMVHFHAFFQGRKTWFLSLARMIPIFPNDLISFTVALTGIKFRKFALFSTLGFLFQMLILTYFGSELSKGRISTVLIVVSLLISILLVILVFRRRVKQVLIEDFHSLEEEGRAMEKKFEKLKIIF